MYYLVAVIAFGILIAVHEAGHFFAAKAFGVQVNEFSLGMGPVLWKHQGKETLYSLRLLPLGGFCAMEGEDGASDSPADGGDAAAADSALPADGSVSSSRAFYSKPVWQRAIILCAGAFMNFVLGFILVLCIVPQASFTEPVIRDFMDGCPYVGDDAFLAGDRIYSVDGHRTFFTEDFSDYMARGGDTHRIVLIRDGKRVVLEKFHMPLRQYVLSDGSITMKYGLYFVPRTYGPWVSVKYAWYQSVDFVRIVWRSLGDILTGDVGIKDLSGPVGIVEYVGQTAAQAPSTAAAWFSILYIFSLIAINLAVMNLLPIPALDGGRVFFLVVTWLLERLLHRKINPIYEGYVHTAGLVLLMGLMLFILGQDVFHIIKH